MSDQLKQLSTPASLPVLGSNMFGQNVYFPLSNIPVNTATNVQLAVGNKGQVFLMGQQFNPLANFSPAYDSRLFLYVHPKGTVDFTPASFERQRDIFVTNIGQDAETDPTPVSWQPARGFFPDAFNFFAYDKKIVVCMQLGLIEDQTLILPTMFKYFTYLLIMMALLGPKCIP